LTNFDDFFGGVQCGCSKDRLDFGDHVTLGLELGLHCLGGDLFIYYKNHTQGK